MSARAIWEATGKDLINRNLKRCDSVVQCRFAIFDETTSWDQLLAKEPWLQTEVISNPIQSSIRILDLSRLDDPLQHFRIITNSIIRIIRVTSSQSSVRMTPCTFRNWLHGAITNGYLMLLMSSKWTTAWELIIDLLNNVVLVSLL